MKRLAALIVAISTSVSTCSAACITMKEAARLIKSYVKCNAMSSELGRCASPNTTPEEWKENIREMIRGLTPETELKKVGGVNRKVVVGYTARICIEVTDIYEDYALDANIDCHGHIKVERGNRRLIANRQNMTRCFHIYILNLRERTLIHSNIVFRYRLLPLCHVAGRSGRCCWRRGG